MPLRICRLIHWSRNYGGVSNLEEFPVWKFVHNAVCKKAWSNICLETSTSGRILCHYLYPKCTHHHVIWISLSTIIMVVLQSSFSFTENLYWGIFNDTYGSKWWWQIDNLIVIFYFSVLKIRANQWKAGATSYCHFNGTYNCSLKVYRHQLSLIVFCVCAKIRPDIYFRVIMIFSWIT